MKRLLAVVLLFLPGLAFGAPRTASVDGLWSATETWGGAAVPELTDSCTISAGIEVVCDADPCQCGDLTVNGGLTMKDGTRTLKLGNATGVAADGNLTITASTGFLIGGAGHTLEINIDRSPYVAAGVLTNNGTWTWAGDRLVNGRRITGVGAISGNAPSRKIVLTDTGLQQPVVDYYSGKYLCPRSGYFREHCFTITTGGTTVNDIAVLTDDRGAMDTRNVAGRVNPTAWAAGDWGPIVSRANGDAAGAIVSVGTTVTFTAGIFADTTTATHVLLGSRFVCADDLVDAADADIRRFCSVTSATVATLCSTYSGAACTGAADDGFFVFDDNQPPKALIVQEAFQIGDAYDIIDPAKITITSGQRSDTAPSHHYNIVTNSGSNTDFHNITIDYCGQDRDGTNQPDCMAVNDIDNSLDSEQFTLYNADIWHFSGETALTLFDCDNITVEHVAVHDATPGAAAGDNHQCHGLQSEDADNSNVTNIIFRNNRVKGANDGGIILDGDPTTGINCTGCQITDNFVGMAPANSVLNGASVQGILSTGGMVNTRISRNFVANIENRPLTIQPVDSTPSSVITALVDGNIIANVQSGPIGQFGLWTSGSGVTDANSKIVGVGNLWVGYREGVERGYHYSSMFVPNNPGNATGLAGAANDVQGAVGNIVLGPGGNSGNSPLAFSSEPDSAARVTYIPSTTVIQDNAVYGSTTPSASGTSYALMKIGANGVTGPNYLVDHNSVVCQERHTTATDIPAIQSAPAASGTVTVSNNVGYDCQRFINEPAAGAGGTTASLSNLRLMVTAADANVDSTSGDLTTGTVSFLQASAGNLACNEGSTPWSSLGSDGYPRGVRVAGPPFPGRFKTVYPFPIVVDTTGLAVHSASDTKVIEILNANTVGDTDSDGDGVWDLHDNCDTVWNASQYDGDADGTGCACDAGDTCP